MSHILRDERLDQKPTLVIGKKNWNVTPGGCFAFVYFFHKMAVLKVTCIIFLIFWGFCESLGQTTHRVCSCAHFFVWFFSYHIIFFIPIYICVKSSYDFSNEKNHSVWKKSYEANEHMNALIISKNWRFFLTHLKSQNVNKLLWISSLSQFEPYRMKTVGL